MSELAAKEVCQFNSGSDSPQIFKTSMTDQRWSLVASVVFILALSLALWALIGVAARYFLL